MLSTAEMQIRNVNPLSPGAGNGNRWVQHWSKSQRARQKKTKTVF